MAAPSTVVGQGHGALPGLAIGSTLDSGTASGTRGTQGPYPRTPLPFEMLHAPCQRVVVRPGAVGQADILDGWARCREFGPDETSQRPPETAATSYSLFGLVLHLEG